MLTHRHTDRHRHTDDHAGIKSFLADDLKREQKTWNIFNKFMTFSQISDT